MHNGHKNYETWNVSLWINNDQGLYNLAKECANYETFVQRVLYDGPFHLAYMTPDHVSWNNPLLDVKALDDLIDTLHSDRNSIKLKDKRI